MYKIFMNNNNDDIAEYYTAMYCCNINVCVYIYV